jgi:dethiobiotin synthetase
MKIFVTGIDTNVGKTIVSAILVKALQYDYWKPIQSGDLKNSDTQKVKTYTQNKATYHKEQYQLKSPLSPHESSKLDSVEISLESFVCPKPNRIIIEGAGGVMVPLNEEGDCIIDLIKNLEAKVILVSKNYLGSINHTLMSCQILHANGIQILGIIINGDRNPASEEIISKIAGVNILGHVDWTNRITQKFMNQQAQKFKSILK